MVTALTGAIYISCVVVWGFTAVVRLTSRERRNETGL